jgi:hypothetical protein
MTDIVDDFIQRLSAALPQVDPGPYRRLESELRQEWGGSKSYVAKRFNLANRTAALGGALVQHHKLSECFAIAGVSRRTGYEILARKNR